MTTYFKYYIPPEIDECNTESITREEKISRRILLTISKETISPIVVVNNDMGSISTNTVLTTLLTIVSNDGGRSLRLGEEGTFSRSVCQDQDINLSDLQSGRERERKQLVQTLTLDDLSPHGLYPNPDKPLKQPDSAGSIQHDSAGSVLLDQ